jgi:hypothetical protein
MRDVELAHFRLQHSSHGDAKYRTGTESISTRAPSGTGLAPAPLILVVTTSTAWPRAIKARARACTAMIGPP